MSKMPAKKKSCFQITSVTTAQVATSITEDTESLDDPDESRTEDVSSEIFDVSRATDYGPEEVCERSSSEETLNNVGDAETPGTVSPNLILDGQLAAASAVPANGGGGVPARSVAGALSQTLAAVATSVSAPGPSSATPSQPPATCSSRFRVIKLDHGSGEPYRRGRWTCMEYYERDSDSSVLSRSGDCIRHSNTLEQTAEFQRWAATASTARRWGCGSKFGVAAAVPRSSDRVAANDGSHSANSAPGSRSRRRPPRACWPGAAAAAECQPGTACGPDSSAWPGGRLLVVTAVRLSPASDTTRAFVAGPAIGPE